MVRELQYTSIQRVLDNLTEHPLLRDVSLEQVVRHTLRFIALHGYTKFYQDKIEDIDIHEFRGTLPCDLISIDQVMDLETGICLRSMTDNFTPGLRPKPKEPKGPHHPPFEPFNPRDVMKGPGPYIPPMQRYLEEPAFKTQGRIIFTSFPEGRVQIAYKAIKVDENGYPMLIDDENYLAALEAYIKMKVFIIKFDEGKINANVLQQAKQDYGWLAGQLRSTFTTPSQSEMESITRYINTMILNVRHFDNGFKDLGDREYLRRH